MIYRSKAPLRIGLAGGGTDVSPYSDLYGGAILNATLSLYAQASIEPLDGNQIILEANDRQETEVFEFDTRLPTNGHLDLLKGVYNAVQRDFGQIKGGFRLSTFVDAPAGSGLGTSSTLVVAIIGSALVAVMPTAVGIVIGLTAATPLGVVGFFGFGAWVLVTSVMMLVGNLRSAPEEAAAAR